MDEGKHVHLFMQVWGISSEDTLVMVRTGVTPSELTGRTWKPISLPISTRETPSPSGDQSSSASPQSSRSGLNKVNSPVEDIEGVEKALADLTMRESEREDVRRQEQQEKQQKGEPEPGEEGGGKGGQEGSQSGSLNVTDCSESPTSEIKCPEESSSSFGSSGVSDQGGEYLAVFLAAQSSPTSYLGVMPNYMNKPKEPAKDEPAREEKKSVVGRQFPVSSKEWSESRLRHASSTSSQGSLGPPREEGPIYNLLPVEDDHLWMWVTGGGCWISAKNMPKW